LLTFARLAVVVYAGLEVSQPEGVQMTVQEKYADKIAKLLRKAESTSPEEAEALLAKAQELATEHAISEAMIARFEAGTQVQHKVIEVRIEYHSVYSRAQFQIGAAIAHNNDCKPLVSKGKDLMRTTLFVIGHDDDVKRVQMLNESIQIQAMRALTAWYAEHEWPALSQREKFKHRRQFLLSFAQGLDRQLRLAYESGRTRATASYVDRTNADTQAAVDSVELVLRDKRENVNEYLEQQYGGQLRRSKGRLRGGSEAAHQAGLAAGMHANVSGHSGGIER
jgi:hypothetical protein